MPTMPAAGTARCWRRPKRWRSWTSATAPQNGPAGRLWRNRPGRRGRRQLRPRRPCPRLGADRPRLQGRAGGRVGRLQAPPRPDLRAVRAGAVRHLHHRGDLRPAGVPPSRHRQRDRPPAPPAARRARALRAGRRLCAGQGAAGDRRAARRAATTSRSIIHGAMERLCRLYEELGVAARRAAARDRRAEGRAARAGSSSAPPGALNDRWSRRLPDPVTAMASGWMRIRQRARQRNVELPLIISDHADWDELTQTIREVAPKRSVDHPRPRGRAQALVHDPPDQGARAQPGRL